MFSPGDRHNRLDAVDLDEYKAISKQSLRAGHDFSHLTSYAGRRNGMRDYFVTAGDEAVGVPVIADTSFPGVILIAYSNGMVRRHSFGDFDMLLPENPADPDPFLGDDASHEALEALSDQ